MSDESNDSISTPRIDKICKFAEGTQPYRLLQVLIRAGIGSLVLHETLTRNVLAMNENGGGRPETRRQRISVLANRVRSSLRGTGYGIDVVQNEGYILNPYEWPNYSWPNGKAYREVYTDQS